jgi:hypothetical protein
MGLLGRLTLFEGEMVLRKHRDHGARMLEVRLVCVSACKSDPD